ncbi:MAG: xanthine dehydrogenase family protein molybdopterin-binding subunit [Alphaproteobacteria bacterium]|nr:xanthine dehydrogenase family protein molybdopterin-binding subunit [Alphaproteobacteria bacterium]
MKDGIGTELRRFEDARLLTGKGRYSDDVCLPGQAHAVVLRAPHAHARILGIDATAARALPGVLCVLTGAELIADGLQPIPHIPAAMSPPDIRLPNTDGSAHRVLRQPVLALDAVRHVGEPVAFVVAETLAIARDAAELVEVAYEALPAVADSACAAATDAPPLWGDRPHNIAVDAQVGAREAVEAAFAGAAHVVRLDSLIQRVTGVPMEPRAALAAYDAADNSYTLWAGGGGVVRPKRELAIILGIAPERVRVIAEDTGGNFGTRNFFYAEFALVAWAAKRIGRPVKWTAQRQECFVSDYQGRDLRASGELALDGEGNFLALRAAGLSNVGAFTASFIPLTKGTQVMTSLYRLPAASHARAVMSNTPPTAPYRSAGRPETMFMIERLIDIAARRHGFDRVELRRRNLVPRSSMPYTNPFGVTYDSGDYPGALERVLQLADWDGFAARRARSASRGLRRGIGLAGYVEAQSGAPQERAEVTVLPEGIVEVVIGTLSAGQGHATSFAQLIAEWLGIEAQRVRLVAGDTARVQAGGGSHSGRSMRLAATTIHQASGIIVERAQVLAAEALEADTADLAFADGHFTVKGTDRRVSLLALAERHGPIAGSGDVDSRVGAYPYGWHVCEVEVDAETGVARIVAYCAIDDVGRAVNPLILHGQTHGGIAQGAGQALMEHCVYDAHGQMLSASFMDYATPRALDLPSFVTALSEVPSTTHPLGMRGGGEGGITPALGVIVNAIVDALADLGVEHIEMPATPERIWRAIAAARGVSSSSLSPPAGRGSG